MAKVQHAPAPKRSHTLPVDQHPREQKPQPAPKTRPEPVKDHFLKDVATAVFQNHPLVILCTQPQIRKVAGKVPIIKDVVDAFCPIVPGAAKILER